MRGSLLTSLVLACGALVFSVGAKAIPMHVGLVGAAGQQSWTSPGFGDPSFLTLSAWEFDSQTQSWVPAYMTDGSDGSGNPGLGVCGSQPDGSFACTQTGESNEIDSGPPQMIDMDITGLHSNWTSLTITLLSVESGELLSGVDCSILLDSSCQPTPVALDPNATFCSSADANKIVTCMFTEQYLAQLGVTDIWIQSRPDCSRLIACFNGNILLGSGLEHGFIMDGTPASVPEPAALGIFGLGVLLIGVFVGLRRRSMR